jgi:hypothetical protein
MSVMQEYYSLEYLKINTINMKTEKPKKKKNRIIQSKNYDFLLELTDDELDLLAGGKLNIQSDFHQSF